MNIWIVISGVLFVIVILLSIALVVQSVRLKRSKELAEKRFEIIESMIP